jgi:hypothetical protein
MKTQIFTRSLLSALSLVAVSAFGPSTASAATAHTETHIFLSSHHGTTELVLERLRVSGRDKVHRLSACHYSRGLSTWYKGSSSRTRLVKGALANDTEQAIRHFMRKHKSSSKGQDLADVNGNIDLRAVSQYHTDRDARLSADDLMELATQICHGGG